MINGSNILSGKNIISDVKDALSECKFTVTDSNVKALYPELTENAFVIPASEKSKNKDVLFSILAEMQARGLKRADAVGAIGGGVVGDITGLAAALYMRGVRWVNIPTTLLAMVDSGIGGKTAIDFNGVKNLVGAFHFPERVVISAHFLKTLPDREWLCGTGELIKTCLLTAAAYDELKAKIKGLTSKDPDKLYSLISLCVNIKNTVVKADPTEKQLRKILNVGHTVGHALESADGFILSHGEYVIKGMMTEIAMCKDLVDPSFYKEIVPTLKMFAAPPRTTAKVVYEKSLSDKKNSGNTVSVMIPTNAGDITEVKLAKADFLQRYSSAVKELKSV